MYIPPFRNHKLIIGGVSAEKLAEQYGTPLYVYDIDVIEARFARLNDVIAYSRKRIHYAMKANSNPRILKILNEKGACLDTVSPFEVELALRAGFTVDRILFTAINLSDDDIRFAREKGVMLNIGSLYTLECYARLYPGTRVSIRVNPDYGAGHHDHTSTGGPESKFGIFQSDLPEAQRILHENKLKLTGIHSHIGSGILEQKKYVDMMRFILNIAKDFEYLEFVDFGGGIGVPYRPDESEFDLESFGATVSELMSEFSKGYGREVTLALEPGRFLTADAGVLLTRIFDKKKTPKFTFVGVDSGFNHLIRPMAYGSYHHIVNAGSESGEKESVVVAGYVCESGDVFTRTEAGPEAREIVRPEPGELLAILTTGAYGFTMASRYNSRPLPAEVVVENGKAILVRRRETLEDLLRGCE